MDVGTKLYLEFYNFCSISLFRCALNLRAVCRSLKFISFIHLVCLYGKAMGNDMDRVVVGWYHNFIKT